MKKTDLEKNKGLKIAAGIKPFGATAVPGKTEAPLSRREQRKLEQASGLVPFAVKLDSGLVAQLQALARERGGDMNATVAEVLTRGLEAPAAGKTAKKESGKKA